MSILAGIVINGPPFFIAFFCTRNIINNVVLRRNV